MEYKFVSTSGKSVSSDHLKSSKGRVLSPTWDLFKTEIGSG